MAPTGTASDPEDDSAPYWIDLDKPPVIDEKTWRIGPITFYRLKSPDGLWPEIVEGPDGKKAVRLAVQADAYAGPLIDEQDHKDNDRCELRGLTQRLGTDVWHGFSIRVPPSFPVRPLRLVVAQMKMPYSYAADGSPAFALRIDSGRWLATVEHLYEPHDAKQGLYLSDPIGGDCAFGVPAFDHHEFDSNRGVIDLQVRAFVAIDPDGLPADVADREHTCCTTGVVVDHHADLPRLVAGDSWTDFIVHIRSAAERGRDGLIELFVDGKPIFSAHGEFGYPDTRGDPVQYFKIGLYRNNDAGWGDDRAALDYRNIRRGRSMADVRLPEPPLIV